MFGTDRAFDPATQTYYHYMDAIQVTIQIEHSYFEGERNYNGGRMFTTQRTANTNSTLTARDFNTGEIKWTFFNPYSHQRSAPVVSGGMVFAGTTDGFIRFFDKDNGDVLNEIGVGSAVVIQATVGHDGNGESKIFTVLGATRLAGAANYGLKGQTSVPGTMAAFGLSAKAAAQAHPLRAGRSGAQCRDARQWPHASRQGAASGTVARRRAEAAARTDRSVQSGADASLCCTYRSAE